MKESESCSVVSDSLGPQVLYSPSNSPGHKVEWGAFPFPWGSSQPRDRTQVSHIANSLPAEPQGKPNVHHRYLVQFSCSVVSDSLRPQRLQHARLPVHHQLKLMSIMLMMPSNHLILSRPLLLPPSIVPSIRIFSSESVLHIRRPKYWHFSFNASPSNEHPGLTSFRLDWLDLLAVQGTLKSLLQCLSSKDQFFSAQLSLESNSHIHT